MGAGVLGLVPSRERMPRAAASPLGAPGARTAARASAALPGPPGTVSERAVTPPSPHSRHHVQGHRGLLAEDPQGRGRQGLLQGRLVQRAARHGRRLCAGPLRRAQEGHLKAWPPAATT